MVISSKVNMKIRIGAALRIITLKSQCTVKWLCSRKKMIPRTILLFHVQYQTQYYNLEYLLKPISISSFSVPLTIKVIKNTFVERMQPCKKHKLAMSQPGSPISPTLTAGNVETL